MMVSAPGVVPDEEHFEEGRVYPGDGGPLCCLLEEELCADQNGIYRRRCRDTRHMHSSGSYGNLEKSNRKLELNFIHQEAWHQPNEGLQERKRRTQGSLPAIKFRQLELIILACMIRSDFHICMGMP